MLSVLSQVRLRDCYFWCLKGSGRLAEAPSDPRGGAGPWCSQAEQRDGGRLPLPSGIAPAACSQGGARHQLLPLTAGHLKPQTDKKLGKECRIAKIE